MTNATVVHIDTDERDKKFRGLEVSTIDGTRAYVTGKLGVLAAGGIENARLLLISNRQHPAGLGNEHDVVGRYLMDHPGTRIGYFKKQDVKAADYLGFYTIPHQGEMVMYMHGLELSPELQRQEKLLNSAVYALPEVALDDPIEAIKRITQFKSKNYLADLWSLVRSIGLLAKGLSLKIFYSTFFPRALQRSIVNFFMAFSPNFVVRQFQSKGVFHKLDCLAIHVMTEQEPNPESRIVLSDKMDLLGLPLARAIWKISAADRNTVLRIGQLLVEETTKAGLPAPVMDDWISENRPEDAPLVDMAHMLGTTRMSDDPISGVVDKHCQVHGVEGLYIVGGSVFPTSSHVNPTLTILALAIRTADQLKKVLASGVSVKASPPYSKAAINADGSLQTIRA